MRTPGESDLEWPRKCIEKAIGRIPTKGADRLAAAPRVLPWSCPRRVPSRSARGQGPGAPESRRSSTRHVAAAAPRWPSWASPGSARRRCSGRPIAGLRSCACFWTAGSRRSSSSRSRLCTRCCGRSSVCSTPSLSRRLGHSQPRSPSRPASPTRSPCTRALCLSLSRPPTSNPCSSWSTTPSGSTPHRRTRSCSRPAASRLTTSPSSRPPAVGDGVRVVSATRAGTALGGGVTPAPRGTGEGVPAAEAPRLLAAAAGNPLAPSSSYRWSSRTICRRRDRRTSGSGGRSRNASTRCRTGRGSGCSSPPPSPTRPRSGGRRRTSAWAPAPARGGGGLHPGRGRCRITFRDTVVRSLAYATHPTTTGPPRTVLLPRRSTARPTATATPGTVQPPPTGRTSEAAELLEGTAERAVARGGHAAHARALEAGRAALTRPRRRARRLFSASRAAFWA